MRGDTHVRFGSAARGNGTTATSSPRPEPTAQGHDWCRPLDRAEPFIAALGPDLAAVRWDLDAWPAVPEAGLEEISQKYAYLTLSVNSRYLYQDEPSRDHTVHVHVELVHVVVEVDRLSGIQVHGAWRARVLAHSVEAVAAVHEVRPRRDVRFALGQSDLARLQQLAAAQYAAGVGESLGVVLARPAPGHVRAPHLAMAEAEAGGPATTRNELAAQPRTRRQRTLLREPQVLARPDQGPHERPPRDHSPAGPARPGEHGGPEVTDELPPPIMPTASTSTSLSPHTSPTTCAIRMNSSRWAR